MSDPIPPFLARFIYHHDLVSSLGRVKYRAFLGSRPPHNTSVDAHGVYCKDIHWEAGRAINSRPLLGAADMHTTDVIDIGFEVAVIPTETNPFHAELQGWSDDKSLRIEKARDLADASCFVPVPLS